MEDFYYEEDSPKHIFLKLLTFIFLVGVIIGGFLYYKKINTIRLKNITIEVGSTLSNNIEDYVKKTNNNISKYKLYINSVNTNVVGKYTYKIRYKRYTKKGFIKVVDTKAPSVILDDNVIINTTDEFDPTIFVLKCEDYSLPCHVSLKNKKDIDKIKNVGDYKLDIVISDKVGNNVNKTVLLKVSNEDTSSKVLDDLDYYTNSINDEKIEHTLFRTLNKAINEDTLEYEGLIQEISSLDFSKYVNKNIYSTKLITVYNKYGYVIGFQVEVTYNDGTKELLKESNINEEEE